MATYTNYNPSKHNDFMTPKYIFEDIKDYIPKNKIISMPFFGDGSCATHMTELGFEVIHQDEDFFEHDRGDIVVDNCPFQFKKKIIKTLVYRDKPFMLILPVSTICYNYSKILKNKLQIIIPKKRPKFIEYDKTTGQSDPNWMKKSCPFDCLWLCYKIGLEKDIIFL